MLSDDFFLAYQTKLEDEPDWLAVLEPRTAVLWRNRVLREALGLPAISAWAEAVLLIETADVRGIEDAVSRALKEGFISCRVVRLRVQPWNSAPFAISVGKLHCEVDGQCALVMLHLLKL